MHSVVVSAPAWLVTNFSHQKRPIFSFINLTKLSEHSERLEFQGADDDRLYNKQVELNRDLGHPDVSGRWSESSKQNNQSNASYAEKNRFRNPLFIIEEKTIGQRVRVPNMR